MGKLKQMSPRLAGLAPKVGWMPARSEADLSRDRDARLAWRAWYKTARWQRLRWSVLVRDLFTCRMCKRIEPVTSQLVADHVMPHRGVEALFWDDGNLQTLCKPCHDGAKQRAEARRR